ncbi:MAG TPA: tRNA (adenosine(37)-N6)-dimethylallyltransferase MiaA [Bryobacteraceae bacterium]
MSGNPFLLIAIVGPTGSGKSELALRLAQEIGGEIVNYDSVQVYRGLDIGSAKLPPAERRDIAHHLIDILDINQELTAGAFARLARPLLYEIAGRGRVPVLVGGTGFYLRALLDGLSPFPERDAELRERLAAVARRRPAALHRFLQRYDAQSAGRIHANDLQKLMRAIEIAGTKRRPPEPLSGFRTFKIGLAPDRKQLYAFLEERSQRMFHNGLVEETAALLRTGISPRAKPLQTLGYKQAVQILVEGRPREAAILECQTRTRQYAKRQFTWFRAEKNVIWLPGFGNNPEIQKAAISSLDNFEKLP